MYGFNTGASSFQFQIVQAACQRCTGPDAVVFSRKKMTELLTEARKITHPDVCSAPNATKITAEINNCLAEINPKPKVKP